MASSVSLAADNLKEKNDATHLMSSTPSSVARRRRQNGPTALRTLVNRLRGRALLEKRCRGVASNVGRLRHTLLNFGWRTTGTSCTKELMEGPLALVKRLLVLPLRLVAVVRAGHFERGEQLSERRGARKTS